MERVQHVRELEKTVKDDVKNVNNMIAIRQLLANAKEPTDARIAAVHALRRITLHYVETGWCHKTVPTNDKANAKKVREYNAWFQAQFATFKDCLIALISGAKDAFHAVAVRTYVEMMKLDTLIESPTAVPQFSIESFKTLLVALVVNKREIDVDLLLMLKDEVFSMHDCTYAALVALRDMITEVKDMQQQAQQRAQLGSSSTSTAEPITANFDTIRKNFIDVLRVIELPDEIDEENVLVPLQPPQAKSGAGDDSDNSGDEGGESSDEERETAAKEQRKEAALQRMDPLLAELAGLKGKKRGAGSAGNASKRARPALSLYEKLQDLEHYKRAFSKAWLALLSLQFSPAQHKLLLKHLHEHVVPHMRNPMLLADFLTQSYASGGLVAVLALESLFHLIVKHNLDYPGFFLSLYNLCTVEVFSAKYRAKFMMLLNSSLKSVNLPVYLVAAFAKRLAHIALHTPSPNSQFCIAQCTWLLRQHPQAQVLIHRKSRVGGGGDAASEFNNSEKVDLEKSHALQSSLWEIELLQSHHIYAAATLATSLSTPESTLITAAAGSAYVHVEDYLSIGYADLMDSALGVGAAAGARKEAVAAAQQQGKREAALAYIKPTGLFADGSLLKDAFGCV